MQSKKENHRKGRCVETHHATVRRQQRGIPGFVEEITLAKGCREWTRDGCQRCYLTRRQREELWESGIGRQFAFNTVFILSPSGVVLTAYHQS
ncbi:hypothetical protein [Ferribacterium limneticum]|uniref:hypothetical protein n=1 Tax=Ferribacterium limneticum TaxID=76259 RepID=UPI001CF80786|nr:hypothetical protein [Ferribacterium limneticum]UCV22551.1 hypothetical protein KI613_18890 [Ferribacterium limneticum]